MHAPSSRSSLPRRGILLAGTLFLGASACEEGPSQPSARGDLMVDATEVQFADTDAVLGSVETQIVTISNRGTGPLTVDDLTLRGSDATSFDLISGPVPPFTLGAGAQRQVVLGFVPPVDGMFDATLDIGSDDRMDGMVSVGLSGTAVRFTYAQVDRMGIPALNTVFNHPSGVGPFDKTAYNVASPADDVASYRDQFIIVLDAVANPDSEGIADLLLPDELPVDMGAPTSFATLTGRAPADDATDVALAVTVGVPALQSDNVQANDKAFLGSFPYLATPH